MFKWKFIISLLLLSTAPALSQDAGLVLGRSLNLPDPGEDAMLQFDDTLDPASLRQYSFVLVFSSAHSKLTPDNILQLQEFVDNGGGLYIGADNWPFYEESNQLTLAFFGKSCWGNQNPEIASINGNSCSNEVFKRQKIPSGRTTVSFPLDYRLKVEAWAGDEPLILSGKLGKGKVVLDGGYSRFNTDLFVSEESGEIFREMIAFLVSQ